MRRIASHPRADLNRVEAVGLLWHTGEQHQYWNESAFYEFTANEIDLLASATNELEKMTLKAAQYAIDNRLYARMGIPELAVPLIERSWEADPPSLYGRFDLMYDGCHPPKLLEYNADTPTALLEAAVVQWYWLEEMHPRSDQFNAIHERLKRCGRNWLRACLAVASIFVRWTTPKIGRRLHTLKTRLSRRDWNRPFS
jgi:glutathionylspermidine synthase